MSDLDKLMAKMGNPKKKEEEKPVENIEVVDDADDEEIEQEKKPVEKIKTDDDIDDEEDEQNKKPVEKKEKIEQVSSKQQDDNSTEQEVAVLQNDGVFRRELVLILGELVDVHKINTQTLIDIKKKLLGEDDDKEGKSNE